MYLSFKASPSFAILYREIHFQDLGKAVGMDRNFD